jgi:hypothetical protein
MTRVLVIEGSGKWWGSERVLLDLLDALQRPDAGPSRGVSLEPSMEAVR